MESTANQPQTPAEGSRREWRTPRLTVADIDSVTNNFGSVAPDYSGEMHS